MREIRFRFRHPEKTEMIYFTNPEVSSTLDFRKDMGIWNYEISMQREADNIGGYNHSDFNETVEGELMQYTGLKDKNGKEIYEGDIVIAIAEEGFKDRTRTSLVTFSESFQWVIQLESGYNAGLPITRGGWESIEIIGNKRENPELLLPPQ